jgi:hypothetical protein
MSNRLKLWWQERQAKHYLKNHWHLFADIVFLLIILALIVTLILVSRSIKLKVDTTPVEHISKIIATTTNESLVVKSEVASPNIYSGKPFDLKITLENTSGKNLTAITLSPAFATSGFTISKLQNQDETSNIKVKNNKLTLDKLESGAKVEANFSVTINAKTDSLRSVAWLLKGAYKENIFDYSNNYNLETLKLVTDLKVKAAAYYNSQLGDQLGSGPIPPMVGLPTNYWIFFEADNQGNDLSNLTVSAKLAEGVTLANSKTLSAGEFAYDESQKRVTWTVKKASVDNNRYQVGFEIQLMPLAKQAGLKPLLVSNIAYVATDAYTGEKLSGKLPVIDTDLPLDSINKGQGKVEK